MTGFTILASSSVQQAHNLAAVAHLSAIESSMPVMHFFDGFRTSHEIKKIRMLEQEDIAPLVDMDAITKFRKKSLSPFNTVTRGTTQNEDIYFQASEVRNEDYNKMPDIINDYMMKINKITDKNYKPFNYHGASNATKIIVAMGSVCDTIKEVVNDLNKKGEKVGLIEVHLYRPFSSKYLLDVLPKSVKKIAVLDRTKEPGSAGEPLYLDIVEVINKSNKKIEVIGGRYGLSSKDTDPSQIKAVYDFLDNKKRFNSFTIGINDDVTNLSLPPSKYSIDNNKVKEFLIYGFGSDGMITASKDIIKIVGDNTDNYVQGYFQYDSKKSGSMTRSHLRFSPHPIKSSYFVKHPEFVVCSKESYIDRYDMLTNMKEKGTFLYVTSKNVDELKQIIPNEFKKILYDRKIKFYTIDAYELANMHGLQNKISMILETCILKISDFIDFDIAMDNIKKMIITNFSKKGDKIVNANIESVKDTMNYLHKVEVDVSWIDKNSVTCKVAPPFPNKIYEKMLDLSANDLKVSDFLPYKDGTYEVATSQYEKRDIAENIPIWIPVNCIQCNQCSFVCPHAVVRPFLLNEEEYNKAPDNIKDKCIDAIGLSYKLFINISLQDCTGCGVCARTCPGKNGAKALDMQPVISTCDATTEYLMKNVTEKKDAIFCSIKFLIR
jgi:pyruvate-ferredoxin/flavodoxin oxidoreductase